MKERDAVRIASVFATDTELKSGTGFAADQAARRTSQPTPGWSTVSKGEPSTIRCSK
jgi:hypothetical protein